MGKKKVFIEDAYQIETLYDFVNSKFVNLNAQPDNQFLFEVDSLEEAIERFSNTIDESDGDWVPYYYDPDTQEVAEITNEDVELNPISYYKGE